MAAASTNDDELITGINVTPLVDITLVLLVVLMITAGYVVSKTIPVDLPAGQTGEANTTTLAISIDKSGAMYLDAQPIDDATLRVRVRAAATAGADPRAVIAADGGTSHKNVVHVMDLLRQEHVTKFAINVQPDELATR